jgi:uncharacterized protein YqeY
MMTTPTLSERIAEATKVAMKAREREKVAALRLMTSEIRRMEIDKRITLDDPGVLSVLARMIKQRNDSIVQFEQAGRMELAAVERYEIEVINAFMPQPLEAGELAALVARAVDEAAPGGQGMQAMGKVMAWLKPRVEGRADMARVSTLVKQALTG